MKKNKRFLPLLFTFLLVFSIAGCDTKDGSALETASEAVEKQEFQKTAEDTDEEKSTEDTQESIQEESHEDIQEAVNSFDTASIPAYSGESYVAVNGNVPYFTDSELTSESYESYSDLDSLGRCGVCIASVGQDIMPTEERGSIGSVKPTGWQTVKYNGVVDGNYLYNRCHLLGYQLTAENANVKNLITGTRYMNVDGMLPFENMVADYVQETNNHVLYRATPIFEGNNLLASGVLMEAKSVEDGGDGILFCVYCYNVQPGVAINYVDGSSELDGTITAPSDEDTQSVEVSVADNEANPSEGGAYAVNSKNGKIHMAGACSATGSGSNAMKNPVYFATYEEAEAYSAQIAPGQDKRQCGNCW